MVLIALKEVQSAECKVQSEQHSSLYTLHSTLYTSASRALRWMLAMQNRDGGWGAFDKDNDSEFLCGVPFADHNAMIDPSTTDLTGRVLESLALWGARPQDANSEEAVLFLRQTQVADVCWYAR